MGAVVLSAESPDPSQPASPGGRSSVRGPAQRSAPLTRVLQISLGLGTGGAERSTVDLLPYLSQCGVDMRILCRGHRSRGAEGDLEGMEEIIDFLTDPPFLTWVRQIRSAVRLIRPDVVHTTLFEADLAGRIACIGTGIPVLTSLVNESYDAARRRDPAVSRYKLEATRLIEASTGRLLSEHFHALTESVADSARTSLSLPRDRITVVPRGRDRARLGERTVNRAVGARAGLGLDPATPVIVTIGRQEFQKGQDVLLRALAALLPTWPGMRLILAGRDGAWSPTLRELVDELSLGDRVLFTGHAENVGDLLCCADVFVLPSRFEGFGGVLIEAMAMRTPIVSSDIGPAREVVGGDTGAVLVPPDDPAALAAGIDLLMKDDNRRESLAKAGLARFETNFTIEVVAAQMADLYREVGNRGRRRLIRPARRT